MDSVHNILASGAFGAGLHAVSYSLGYGFKKLKDHYYSPSGLLSQDVATNNPAINQQFKNLVNKLQDKTHPTTNNHHSSLSFDIKEAQAIKDSIWQEGIAKFPKFFEQEQHIAKFEEMLHQLFATGGDETKIPNIFLQQLNEQKNKLWQIYDNYSSNLEFMEIQQRLQDMDTGIWHRLESMQQQLKAYDLDTTDLYIAARQLEDGKLIDLDDPNNAKSLFEGQHQPVIYQTESEKIEKTKQAQQDKQTKHLLDELVEAKNYIDRFPLAPSEGFKDYLKQVNLRQVTISRELESGLINDLIKADLLEIFKDKHYERAIAQEIYNITGQDKKATNSPKVVACAKIIDKWQNAAITRANRAGANIEQLPGYITRQSHNSYAIRQAGFASWQEFISPLLDWQIMDKDIDLQQVFNNLATGKHLYQCDEYLPSSFYLTNIAKYFKSARKLHFKSVDSWLKYNEIFGKHNLFHSIAINLQKLGKATGLLESMGKDPKATLNKLKEHYIEGLQAKAANNDKLALAELEFLGRRKLDDILDLMIGITPDNPLLASIDRNLRNIKILSSLGNITLSSIPDSAVFVAEQMCHGLPMIQAFANIAKALTYSFSSKEKKANGTIQHSMPLPSAMYSNDLKKKKNKLQDTIIDEQLPNPTIEQTPLLPSLSPSAVPQTIKQARKVYAISSDNIASQNIIEASESIAEKVAELNKLEELQQTLLATENTWKLEVMNYMQLHTYLKKGDHILVSWKSTTRKTFEIPKFKEDFPDLYTTYVKEISTRNFRLY